MLILTKNNIVFILFCWQYSLAFFKANEYEYSAIISIDTQLCTYSGDVKRSEQMNLPPAVTLLPLFALAATLLQLLQNNVLPASLVGALRDRNNTART